MRNIRRFPEDFMFRLSEAELRELVTSGDRFKSLKHSSSAPYVFTEHGAIMASMVLSSMRAVEMSVKIVRAFVQDAGNAFHGQGIVRQVQGV